MDEQKELSSSSESSMRNKGLNRRNLVKGVLATPVVLSIASRPAWGTNCSISGLLSGNLSRSPGSYECTPGNGQTPGFWMNHPECWPAPYTPGYTNDPDGIPGTSFQAVTGFTSTFGNTFMDILDPQACDNGAGSLEFHVIAAILSAAHPLVNYGYSVQEILDAYSWVMLYHPEKMGQLHEILTNLNERPHIDAKILETNPDWDREKLGRVVIC